MILITLLKTCNGGKSICTNGMGIELDDLSFPAGRRYHPLAMHIY